MENEWLLERAQIVLDIDQYMSAGELKEERWFPEWVHVLRAKHVKKVVAQATNNEVRGGVQVQVQVGEVDAKMEVIKAELDAQVKQVDRKVDALSEQLAEVLRVLGEMREGDEAKEDEDE